MSAAESPGNALPNGAAVNQVLRLDLPAAHSAARLVRRMIRIFAKSVGIAGTDLDELLLVASELVGNAVDHGGGGAALDTDDHRSRMKLALELSPGGWVLQVSDQGGGRPEVLRELIQPSGPPDLEDERGRGFFLIGQMVDRISVELSEDGAGLRLVAEKHRPRIGDR